MRANSEIRRTVVGQLFAYAAAMWEMTYEEFDEAWQRCGRPPLLDDVAAAVDEHGLSWDRDVFPASVAANLAAGRYTLVVAVDDNDLGIEKKPAVAQALGEANAGLDGLRRLEAPSR